MQVNTPNFLFEKVDELKGKKFIQISGTSEHCLAVCNDGSVYGFGLNSNGRLGVGLDKMRISKFTKISSLRNYTILSACAGCDHSLFITKEGKVLACGSNYYGQLFIRNDKEKEFVDLPIETSITKDATFCIAGNCLSAVFVGCEPPPNIPNKSIIKPVIFTSKMSESERLKAENELLIQENMELRKQVSRIQKIEAENASLNDQISALKIYSEQFKEMEQKSKSEFNKYKDKIEMMKNLNQNLKQKEEENANLKKEIERLKNLNKKKPQDDEEENANLKEEIERLKNLNKNKLQKKEEENTNLKEEIQYLKNLNKNIQQKGEEENENLKKEIKRLKAILNTKPNQNPEPKHPPKIEILDSYFIESLEWINIRSIQGIKERKSCLENTRR